METLSRTMTHAELITNINNSTLNKGEYITISDHATKHNLQDGNNFIAVINTGNTEPLTVMALSSNKVAYNAYSTLFPKDIIRYDATDVLCEDGITPRKGKIIYREDEFGNSTYYDFRNVKFRRWKFDLSGFTQWASGQDYYSGQKVAYSGMLFVCYQTILGSTSDPGSLPYHFAFITDNFTHRAWQTTQIAMTGYNSTLQIPVNAASYVDAYTFNNTGYTEKSIWFKNVKIGKSQNIYNSIIFVETASNLTYSIRFGEDNKFMTFGSKSYNINFGNSNHSFLFTLDSRYIDIGSQCYGIKFGEDVSEIYLKGRNFYLLFEKNVHNINMYGISYNINLTDSVSLVDFKENNFDIFVGRQCTKVSFGFENYSIKILQRNGGITFERMNSNITIGGTYEGNNFNNFIGCANLNFSEKKITYNSFKYTNISPNSNATHISNFYLCEVYKNSAGQGIVSYVNEVNALVIASVNT